MQKWFVFGKNSDFDLAIQRLEQAQVGEAAMLFEEALSNSRDLTIKSMAREYLVTCLAKLAIQSLGEGEFLEAVALLLKAQKLVPEYADVALKLAVALWSAGDFEQAQKAADLAVEKSPHFALAQEVSSAIAGGMEASVASDLVDRVLQPNHQLAIQQAKGLVSQEKFEEAFAALTPVAEACPRFADVQCLLGQCLFAMGTLEQAESHFKAALTLNPKYADAHANYGVLLKRAGRADEAASHFKLALEVSPHHPIALSEASRR